MPIGERLLTLPEAADVLRLNPRTVRGYVQRGEIEASIIGGRWRFRRADLQTEVIRTGSESLQEKVDELRDLAVSDLAHLENCSFLEGIDMERSSSSGQDRVTLGTYVARSVDASC